MNRIKIFIILIVIIVIINLTLSCLNSNTHFTKEFLVNKDNSLINNIDQVYVVNMDKDKKRLRIFTIYMNKLNIKFKRITGIDGKKVYSKYKTYLSPGELGCLLSHINIMKDAIKNNYENILVLEDDIIFHKDFHNILKKTYNNIIKNEKRFDLIYLGYNNLFTKFYIKNKYYFKTKNTNGTYAMIINKNIFKEILKQYNKLNVPSDQVLNNSIQPYYKCFNFTKPIITVNNKVDSNTLTRPKIHYLFYYLNNVDINNFVNLNN